MLSSFALAHAASHARASRPHACSLPSSGYGVGYGVEQTSVLTHLIVGLCTLHLLGCGQAEEYVGFEAHVSEGQAADEDGGKDEGQTCAKRGLQSQGGRESESVCVCVGGSGACLGLPRTGN